MCVTYLIHAVSYLQIFLCPMRQRARARNGRKARLTSLRPASDRARLQLRSEGARTAAPRVPRNSCSTQQPTAPSLRETHIRDVCELLIIMTRIDLFPAPQVVSTSLSRFMFNGWRQACCCRQTGTGWRRGCGRL